MTLSVLHVVPAVFLIVIAAVAGVLTSAVFAIVFAFSVSYYALAIMVRYSGLSPSMMLYSASFFLRYSLFLMPPVIILLGLAFIATEFSLAALILIIPSYFLLKGSFEKWDREDLPGF